MKHKIIFMLLFMVLVAGSVSAANSWDTANWKHYWSHDNADVSGVTSLDSQGSNNGTINGASTGLTGQINQAFRFDGDNDDVTYNILDEVTGGFTVSVWLKPDVVTTDMSVFDISDAGADNRIYLEVEGNDNGGIRWWIKGDSTNIHIHTEQPEQLIAGKWYHVVGTYDGSSQINTYINASLDSTANGLISDSISPTTDLFIGSDFQGNKRFDGFIDEINIWYQELTPSQITDVFNEGSANRRLEAENLSVTQTISLSLLYPPYVDVYNGSVLVSLSDVNGSATCDINNSDWVLQNSGRLGNETAHFYRSGFIPADVYHLTVNCTDNSNTTSLSFNVSTFSNQTIALEYPINDTVYYSSNYNGSIIYNINNPYYNTTCDINDSRWTLQSSTTLNDGDQAHFLNTGYIDTGNYYFKVNCTDLGLVESVSYLNFTIGNNFSINLIYPNNETSYFGNYNGSIVINMTQPHYNATCSINDSRWSLQTSSPFTNNTLIMWQNNTELIASNNSIFINCIDQSNLTKNLTFYFTLKNILVISFLNEQTEELITAAGYVEIYDENSNFAINQTINGTYNFTNLPRQIEIRYDADGYHKRAYYATLSYTKTEAINLYLLNESTDISTLIVYSVFDQDGDAATNVTLKLQRNYISSSNVSEFKTISMTRTNFEGEAIFYVELYDVWYKTIFTDNAGNIYKITDPSPFLTVTPQEQLNIQDDVYLSFRQYDSVIYNLTFINQSNNMTYARFFYSDVNNVLRTACLKVQRITTTGIYNICNNCSSSSSGTISCLFNASLPGQFKATALIDTDTENSWYSLDTGFYTLLDEIDYGQQGVFWSAVIIGTLILMGAVSTITGSILFMLVGVIGVAIIGFTTGINLGMIWWLVLLGFIIIFLVARRRAI